jgi:hypothetical protein
MEDEDSNVATFPKHRFKVVTWIRKGLKGTASMGSIEKISMTLV